MTAGMESEEVMVTESSSLLDTMSSASIRSITCPTHDSLYLESQWFLQNFVNNYDILLQDGTNKSIRNNCVRVVNRLIDDELVWKQSHIQTAYQQLANLLIGKSVVIKKTQIPAMTLPHVLEFCTNLIAEKFISLHSGILNDQETVFCHAAVIIALWNKIPHFGKLLLANFYKECPYSVPMYPRSKEERKGFSSKHFVQQMVGIMRLYAAVLISEPPVGYTNKYGLPYAWRWLATFLNFKPDLDISAELLLAFLEITNPTLQDVYGKVYDKVVAFIRQIYIPLLRGGGSEDAVTKLMRFLNTYKL